MFKISKKTIASGVLGNMLEMYDYTIWGIFSVFLTNQFLPPNSNLSDIFFLFFLTYIIRPIGSFICGILSDQLGRKKILIICMLIMGLCTSAVALIPSYKNIGIISTILLLSIRLIQVLAMSGEYISSISLLIESCEKNKRGFFGSWAAVGVNCGTLTASLIGALILYLININLIPEYGWKFAFIISFITMAVGLWIRKSIPESFDFVIENSKKEQRGFFDIANNAISTLITEWHKSIIAFILVLFGSLITVLIFIYSPIQMALRSDILSHKSLLINSASLFLLIIMIPFFGSMSDRYGRIKILSLSISLLSVIILPYFSFIKISSFYNILIYHMLLGIPCAGIFSIVPTFISEIFPISIRCSIVGFIYPIAVFFGGGLIPFLVFKLNNILGEQYIGLLVTVIGISSLVTLLTLKLKKHINNFKLELIKI